MATPPTCYFSHAGIITQVNDQRPCASTANGPTYCCAIGDFCEGDNICHFTHPDSVLGGVYSSYYLGGCTDLSYGNSTVCTPYCTKSDLAIDGRQTDVVYNSSSKQWACCGATKSGPHCDIPSNEVFQARAPSAMTNTVSVLSTGIPTYSPSTSTSSSTSSTPSEGPTNTATSTPSAESTNSGLPSGTKTGIGIGVAIGVVALIILIVILLVSRRKHWRKLEAARRSQAPVPYHPSYPGSKYPSPGQQYGIPTDHVNAYEMQGTVKIPQRQGQDMAGQDYRALEMDAGYRAAELDAEGRRPR